MTLTPIGERLAVELSICFYDLSLSRLGCEHSTFPLHVGGWSKEENRV